MLAKVNAQAGGLDIDRPQSGHRSVDNDDRVYLAAGDVVANKYRVDRILGVGGVGFVVSATHVELGGRFALKFLKRRFLHDKTIGERFTREARAACRISSDYVARVFDVGSHDGAPFIVLEHLVGRDLATVLAERRVLSLHESAEYGIQVCAALSVAHANGIVHRDIKPENLFIVDEQGLPTVKLLDFGISKFVLAPAQRANDEAWQEEPITGALTCGTPDYMSPEQIRSTASVDARSDVWSLGMVLYELLVSTPAFQHESVADTCAAILRSEPRRMDAVRPEIPSGFADVVARCLQKDPAKRFATVAELAIALLPFAPPRALAIAENSEWIRRAAIQTVGTGTDPRVPSGQSISSQGSTSSSGKEPSPLPTGVSVESPVVASAPLRRWFGAATAVVVVSVAAIGVRSWIGGHGTEGRGSPPRSATAASPSTPELVPALVPSASPAAPSVPAALPAPSNARTTRTLVKTPSSSKATSSSGSSSFPSGSAPMAAPSPTPLQSGWQTVTAPSTRTVRAIESANPWSTPTTK